MLYYVPGFTHADLLEMSPSEREWYLDKLTEQKKAEERALRKR